MPLRRSLNRRHACHAACSACVPHVIFAGAPLAASAGVCCAPSGAVCTSPVPTRAVVIGRVGGASGGAAQAPAELAAANGKSRGVELYCGLRGHDAAVTCSAQSRVSPSPGSLQSLRLH